MPEDSTTRRSSPRQRRRADPPWVAPDAPSTWWSAPTRPPRVVDAASASAVRPRPAPPSALPAPAPTQPPQRPDHDASPLAAAETWMRGGGPQRAVRGIWGKALALVALLVVVALAFQAFSWLQGRAKPTPTPLPVQTELDGVITVTNLDPQAPYDGDIQVIADNGAWYCRNAPLPDSTWHVHLNGGATTTMACVIPVSSPSTIAPHTFRKAVPSTNGTGLALVDNPSAFQRSSFIPTLTSP